MKKRLLYLDTQYLCGIACREGASRNLHFMGSALMAGDEMFLCDRVMCGGGMGCKGMGQSPPNPTYLGLFTGLVESFNSKL